MGCQVVGASDRRGGKRRMKSFLTEPFITFGVGCCGHNTEQWKRKVYTYCGVSKQCDPGPTTPSRRSRPNYKAEMVILNFRTIQCQNRFASGTTKRPRQVVRLGSMTAWPTLKHACSLTHS